MFCEHPNGNYPCGKCRACKLAKANKKMIVSVFAAHEYKTKGQFLTLTFNDKHKPDGLDHSIFSGFMKRLRKRDGTPDVKFFMAGEYGESGDDHREHFHVLFYNHKYDMKDVDLAWSDPITGESYGFTYDGTCTPASMKYVSGYIDKKGYDPESGKKPPYGRSSCNIPDGLSDVEIERMSRTGKIQYNGHNFSVPDLYRRRYKDVWSQHQWERDDIRKKAEEDSWNDLVKKYGLVRANEFKQSLPLIIAAKMDERDRKLSIKKSERKKSACKNF